MTAAELLTAAEQARPELMKKVAVAIELLEEISPLHARDLKSDIAEITGYTTTKLAAVQQGYGAMSRWGAALGTSLVAGLAGSAAVDLYDAAKRGLNKGSNFRRIMTANPELKHYEKERLHNAYDAIHHYAPEFTSDPMLGGTLLKSVVEVPGNEYTIIKDLLNARKNLQDAKHTQYRPGTVAIELPSSADIAAETVKRQHDDELAARRHGWDTEGAAAELRAKQQSEVRRRVHEKQMERTRAANAAGLERLKTDSRNHPPPKIP